MLVSFRSLKAERMNATPKRVDVDMEVARVPEVWGMGYGGKHEMGQAHKVINWIDPSDRLIF